MNAAQIKENISIVDYLRGMGIEPTKTTARGYMYRCPWREDIHPSLSVTPDGRAWYDHATGEHGSIIDLVMKIAKTTDLGEVCAMFSSSFHPSMSVDQRKEKGEVSPMDAFSRFKVVPLRSRGLFAYLNERGIPSEVAQRYCKEARYSFKDKDGDLYAVAFQNDSGGYELRSRYFKGSSSPKDITTIFDHENAPIVVFEGFIDFLSFVSMDGDSRHNYCVLNSVSNAEKAVEVLKDQTSQIYLCLDNDEAGQRAASYIVEATGGKARTVSQRFAPFKDLNEYLVNRKDPFGAYIAGNRPQLPRI